MSQATYASLPHQPANGDPALDDTSAHLAGELSEWPSKRKMARLLTDAGLRVVVGRHSVRVEDCGHFCFHNYGGDICEPEIDADADSVEEMQRAAQLVSDALTHAGIRHRFELYSAHNDIVGYRHHDWPLAD